MPSLRTRNYSWEVFTAREASKVRLPFWVPVRWTLELVGFFFNSRFGNFKTKRTFSSLYLGVVCEKVLHRNLLFHKLAFVISHSVTQPSDTAVYFKHQCHGQGPWVAPFHRC